MPAAGARCTRRFFTVAAATLPTGSYTNIAAQHGTVQTDAKTQLVCFLAMPGMAETFGGLLPEALSGLEDYMLDELVIEADVKKTVHLRHLCWPQPQAWTS